ncbi:hypothetical protein BASA61_000507 [Batrachochytrium salamandrivorans]|nr:hypothetical protein BASA61_000507 [Batrachochytrium salamandrivorans]
MFIKSEFKFSLFSQKPSETKRPYKDVTPTVINGVRQPFTPAQLLAIAQTNVNFMPVTCSTNNKFLNQEYKSAYGQSSVTSVVSEMTRLRRTLKSHGCLS